MSKKTQNQSSLLISLALPAVMMAAYASYIRIDPPEKQARIARLEEDLQRVKAREVSVEQRVSVVQRTGELNEQLKEANARLESLRGQAGELMRGDLDPMAQLKVGGDLNRILASSGLRLINDSPIASNNSPKLLASLDAATKNLGDTLTELSSQDADNVVIQLP
ncbi:MAG: hypothetical protein MI861_20160, partial [Pirellulales bacterium]|nr:hypothetical protein [Pirellulales bacterium]